MDKTPPPWDPADHIAAGYDYYAPLAHLDMRCFAREFFIEPHYYAPFVHLVTAVIFLIFGASELSGIGVNFVSLAILLASVYWMSQRLFVNGKKHSSSIAAKEDSGIDITASDDRTNRTSGFSLPSVLMGVLAALLVACYHFSAWLIHDGFLDYPLIAMVAAGFALLIRAEDFQRRRDAILFGVVAGCGILTKQTFAFFFILPALYVTFRVLMSRNWRAILNLLLAGIILTAIAAIWYVPHIREVIAIYKINNEAAIAEHEAPLFSFKSNIFYIHALISHQLQLPLATLFLAGLIYSLIRFRRESMLLYLWIISGIGVFSMLPNKDLRYTVPVYPAVALLSVCWVGDLRFNWRRKFSLVLKVVPLIGIATWAFLSFFNAQFPAQGEGFFLDTPDFRWMVFARNYFGYDHRPWNNDWGVPESVQAIEKDWNDNLSQEAQQGWESSRGVCPSKAIEQSATETHTKPLVGVVVNLPFLNPSSINLYARLLTQHRSEYPPILVDWLTTDAVKDRLENCDYVIVRTFTDKDELSCQLEPYARDWLKEKAKQFRRIASFPILIEGAEVVVYRRLR